MSVISDVSRISDVSVHLLVRSLSPIVPPSPAPSTHGAAVVVVVVVVQRGGGGGGGAGHLGQHRGRRGRKWVHYGGGERQDKDEKERWELARGRHITSRQHGKEREDLRGPVLLHGTKRERPHKGTDRKG